MNANLAETLTIQILGWNSAAQLPTLLATVVPHADAVQVRYIDNASTDNSVEIVRAALPNASIISLPENTGYGGGHNIGLKECTTPFVLTVNPDTELNWEGVVTLVDAMRRHPTWGAAQGFLIRPGTPPRIDSAGIQRTITLNGVDRGAGEVTDQFTQSQTEIDGVTGACALLRMQALQTVAYGPYTIAGRPAIEVFDKSFFAYKEDVDLGWRLQRANWKVVAIPAVTATHVRQLKQSGKAHSLAWIADARTGLSLRNYVWMIAKNISITQLFVHAIFIASRLAIFFVISIIYWPLLGIWLDTLRGLPDMLHKRSYEANNNHR